jgi:RNA polymerase sigma-70 factor, ECF subfamily
MSNHPENIHNHDALPEAFVTQLTAAQGNLYVYVCALLGGTRDAADVLQETNLVLWRKGHEFDIERDFTAWAHKFAYLQVMAHREKQARDRHVSNFSEDTLGKMAVKFETYSSEFAHRVLLLDECIRKLSDYQRELIRLRYVERLGVKTISHKLRKSENNIATALYRARLSLIECVETTPEFGNGP